MSTDRVGMRLLRSSAARKMGGVVPPLSSKDKQLQPNNKTTSSVFHMLTENNGQTKRRFSQKNYHRTLQSIDLKPRTSNRQTHQPPRLSKPFNSDELSRLTKRFPFAKTTRPLLFMMPYVKSSFDRTILEKTKNELYEQMNKYTQEVIGPMPVQYMTQYGDQFYDQNQPKPEKRPKNLSISMVRDKIMRRARKSRYLERLNKNFVNGSEAGIQ